MYISSLKKQCVHNYTMFIGIIATCTWREKKRYRVAQIPCLSCLQLLPSRDQLLAVDQQHTTQLPHLQRVPTTRKREEKATRDQGRGWGQMRTREHNPDILVRQQDFSILILFFVCVLEICEGFLKKKVLKIIIFYKYHNESK